MAPGTSITRQPISFARPRSRSTAVIIAPCLPYRLAKGASRGATPNPQSQMLVAGGLPFRRRATFTGWSANSATLSLINWFNRSLPGPRG